MWQNVVFNGFSQKKKKKSARCNYGNAVLSVKYGEIVWVSVCVRKRKRECKCGVRGYKGSVSMLLPRREIRGGLLSKCSVVPRFVTTSCSWSLYLYYINKKNTNKSLKHVKNEGVVGSFSCWGRVFCAEGWGHCAEPGSMSWSGTVNRSCCK